VGVGVLGSGRAVGEWTLGAEIGSNFASISQTRIHPQFSQHGPSQNFE